MTNLFLIAHKVRSEPAFDIAIQLPCVLCQVYENTTGQMVESDHRIAQEDCIECDGLGYWWIIPTSGHRAYPSDYTALDLLYDSNNENVLNQMKLPITEPDHYPTRAAPTVSLIDALGLRKPKVEAPSTPIARRF